MKAKSIVLISMLVLLSINLGCKKEEKIEQKAVGQKASEPSKVTTTAPILQYTFEEGTGKWWPMGDVKVEQSTSQKHTGNASVKIIGSSPKEKWSYALANRFPLESGKKYKFTGWMLVESISNAKFPPILRVGIFQKQNWLQNAITPKYDMAHKGEWQMFSTAFTTPNGSDSAEISLEKGTNESEMTIAAYLDDLTIVAQ
jgi:hypothetical protein